VRWTKTETDYNIRVELRTRARDADKRLTAKGDASYASKECNGGEVQDRLVDLYTREPKAMPLFRVIQRFAEGAVAHVEDGQVTR
jgi:hypothetical protein